MLLKHAEGISQQLVTIFQDKEREVTREEGMTFAQEHKCLFLECSAKTRENVQQCFKDIVLKVDFALMGFHFSNFHFVPSSIMDLCFTWYKFCS